MPSSVYVALSAQVALERRLNTIANNVANMNTPGFRAEEVKFETLLARAGGDDVAYASEGDTFVSRRAGPVNYTGNPLDVAIDGEAWFGLSTPDGTVYTRDGRLQINEAGELKSAAGYPVVDPGGSAIVLDPAGGEVVIGSDGSIAQGGRQVGALGLFTLPTESELTRFENSGVMSSEPGQQVEDLAGNGVRQGYLEGANVNPILEIAKLVTLSRAFENAASAVAQGESTQQQAIRELGPA